MTGRLLLFLLCLTVAVCLTLPVSAAAQGNPLDEVRIDISAGKLDDAQKLLNTVNSSTVDINDYDFLQGQLALAHKDYDKAISSFRAVLTRNPSLKRVRLDLARTFFLKGDDAIAEYHFHLAEAGGLPPAVQTNVDKILDQIRRRKKWTANASFGLQPSTNINTATSVQTIDLYGQPYQLSQAAQKTSGVGVVAALSGSYQAPLNPYTRLVVGSSFNGTNYIRHNFDDNSVSAFIGPRFLLTPAAEATIEATATQRWYGGQDYYTGGGGRIEGKATLSPRWQLEGALSVQQLNYQQMLSAYTGPVTTASAAVIYGIDADSSLRLDSAVIHEQTATATFRDTQYFAGPTYYREFPKGFIGNIGFNADVARFAAPLALFDQTRHDLTVNYQVGMSNRVFNLFGFMPTVSYIHTNRYSNIPIYTFNSDRVILGATQNF